MKPTSNILLLDDDESFRLVLGEHLAARGFEIHSAATIAEAGEVLGSHTVDVLLVDQNLPDGDGIDFAKTVMDRGLHSKVMLITAFAEVERAVEAMRAGVFDYLQKPLDLQELEVKLRRALRTSELEKTEQLHSYLAEARHQPPMVGQSAVIERLRAELQLAADAYPAAVMITGETGVGKGLAARIIHDWSPISKRRYLTINCAAIPHTMVESELFGHERGAFTGAHQARRGVFELASGGTLVLDEIGEIPLALQPKLLTVLDNKVIRRVGGEVERPVELRVIATTNQDIEEMVKRGEFRADLFYRLAVFRIVVPPLRERIDDLELLLNELQRPHGFSGQRLFDETQLASLRSYDWPGNVRELKNIVERYAIATAAGVSPSALLRLLPRTLPPGRSDDQPWQSPASTRDGTGCLPSRSVYEMADSLSPPHSSFIRNLGVAEPVRTGEEPFPTLSEIEQRHITKALDRCRQNKTAAARLLGISRSTLHRKLSETEELRKAK